MPEKKSRPEEMIREQKHVCPLCLAWDELFKRRQSVREMCDHVKTAQIEVLKGVRALVDSGIEFLEKSRAGAPKSEFKKVDVSE